MQQNASDLGQCNMIRAPQVHAHASVSSKRFFWKNAKAVVFSYEEPDVKLCSQCSKSCGRGTRTRESYCMNNLGRRLAERECSEYQRAVAEPCNDTPCPDWSISEWTEVGFKHTLSLCSDMQRINHDEEC